MEVVHENSSTFNDRKFDLPYFIEGTVVTEPNVVKDRNGTPEMWGIVRLIPKGKTQEVAVPVKFETDVPEKGQKIKVRVIPKRPGGGRFDARTGDGFFSILPECYYCRSKNEEEAL